ncbi:general secretion pathway protein M [Legionella lansingensis]|uniref:Putative general secretion pathway protein YghD n=1 Tax=Legionella lansingensis TaxID=45067 RepID=A0A0W0VTJ8_9GAMM|nr:type II secretion system protein M [Legionella lansingensis]KTD23572.1 putative general secretion pathway protein YghD [Legionella lansingensis]SNV52299.1 general secretion pathway protein M [Legionella lansingensis]
MNYWNNLNERERWMVGITAVCVLFYLFYLLIYSPLTTAVDSKSGQLKEKKETLTWMQQARQQPKNKKNPQVISNAKLLALIDGQLTSSTLKRFTYQLQQTGSGDVQLSFDQVPFNSFLSWLWTLTNNYAITLKQFSAEKTDTPGVVKLTVLIATK